MKPQIGEKISINSNNKGKLFVEEEKTTQNNTMNNRHEGEIPRQRESLQHQSSFIQQTHMKEEINNIQMIKNWKSNSSSSQQQRNLEALSKYFQKFQSLDMCLKERNFEKKVNDMMEKAIYQSLEKGEFLFHAGQRNKFIYFVLSGNVSAFSHKDQRRQSMMKEENLFHQKETESIDENSQQYILTLKNDKIKDYFFKNNTPKFERVNVYGVESCFGQSSLKQQSFSAVAMNEQTEVLKIKIADFDEIFDYIKRRREYILIPLQRIFEGKIKELILEELWSMFEQDERHITFGEYLFKEGDVIDRIYLVKDGTFHLSKKLKAGSGGRVGENLISILAPGELFGFENSFCESKESDMKSLCEMKRQVHEFSCSSASENTSVFFADIFHIQNNDNFKKVREELSSKAIQQREFYQNRISGMNKIYQSQKQQLKQLEDTSNNATTSIKEQNPDRNSEEFQGKPNKLKNPTIKAAFSQVEKRLEAHKKNSQQLQLSNQSSKQQLASYKYADSPTLKSNNENYYAHQNHMNTLNNSHSVAQQMSFTQMQQSHNLQTSSSQPSLHMNSEKQFSDKSPVNNSNKLFGRDVCPKQSKNFIKTKKWEGFRRGISKIEKEVQFKAEEVSQREILPQIVYLVSSGLPQFEEQMRIIKILRSSKVQTDGSSASLSAASKVISQQKEQNQDDRTTKTFKEHLKKVLAKKKKRGYLLENIASDPSLYYLGNSSSLPTLLTIQTKQNQCHEEDQNQSQPNAYNASQQGNSTFLPLNEETESPRELKDTIFSLSKQDSINYKYIQRAHSQQDITQIQQDSSSSSQIELDVIRSKNGAGADSQSYNIQQYQKQQKQQQQYHVSYCFQSGKKRKESSSQLYSQSQSSVTQQKNNESYIEAQMMASQNNILDNTQSYNQSSMNKDRINGSNKQRNKNQGSLSQRTYKENLYAKHKYQQSLHQKKFSQDFNLQEKFHHLEQQQKQKEMSPKETLHQNEVSQAAQLKLKKRIIYSDTSPMKYEISILKRTFTKESLPPHNFESLSKASSRIHGLSPTLNNSSKISSSPDYSPQPSGRYISFKKDKWEPLNCFLDSSPSMASKNLYL